MALSAVPLAFCADFRPPGIPLVVHDPYFSIWSMADHLTDEPTKHWTGTVQSLSSLVRVDGTVFRIMGTEPYGVPALPQTQVRVLPTHTIYDFEGVGIHATLTFLTPALPQPGSTLAAGDLPGLAGPFSGRKDPSRRVVFRCRSTDCRQHHGGAGDLGALSSRRSSNLTIQEPSSSQFLRSRETICELIGDTCMSSRPTSRARRRPQRCGRKV